MNPGAGSAAREVVRGGLAAASAYAVLIAQDRLPRSRKSSPYDGDRLTRNGPAALSIQKQPAPREQKSAEAIKNGRARLLPSVLRAESADVTRGALLMEQEVQPPRDRP